MTGEFVTTATVKAGKLSVRRWDRVDAFCRGQKDGTEFVVRIERKRATRSQSQNAWYWSTIVEYISQHTGFTPDETHDVLKQMFLPKRLAVANQNGVIQGEVVIGGTTTSLSTEAFSTFCEDIRRWAAEFLDVLIPDPEGNFNQRPVTWMGDGKNPQHQA